MSFSPVLISHICGGIVGVLSGAAAVAFRKGSRRHALAGNVFSVSMVAMSLCGVYLAIMKSRTGDILGGTLTPYLVATSWMTIRRRNGKPGVGDWTALVVAIVLAAVTVTFGLQAAMSPSGMVHGYPPGVYVFLSSVILIAAAGDIRMLVRGGISGTQRIARHLWRMCFAFFIASASIFLARQRLFPTALRETGVLYILTFLPLAVMVFWLVRVRVTKAHSKKSVGRDADAYAIGP